MDKTDSPYAAGPTSGAPQQFYMTQSPQQVEADKAAQLSIVFGIVGFFFLGILFGPLAIIQAKKAEQLGRAATAGKVLGWIITIWAALAIIVMLLMFGVLGISAASV